MAKKITPESVVGSIKNLDLDGLVVVAKEVAKEMEKREDEAVHEIEIAKQKLAIIQGK